MSTIKLQAPVLTIGEFKDKTVVRTSATNDKWGSIMLNHETFSFNDGAMFKSRRVAFFRAELDNIDLIVKAAGELKAGENFNDKLVKLGVEPMRIVRRETFEKQHETHTPKTKGADGEVILVDGKPVFMQDILVPMSSAEQDSLIKQLSNVTVTTEEVVEEGEMS